MRATTDIVNAVAETCAAYDRDAPAYARATAGYDDYPGLRAAIASFADQIPHRLPVLDIGCGGGRDARMLAGGGMKVVAADMSMGMLTQARARAQVGPRPTIVYVRLNMLDLPFADMRFGGVWACASVLHLPSRDMPRALRDIWRTLVPGGRVALSMRAGDGEGWRSGGTLPGRRWFTFVDPPGFADELARVGFEDVEIQFVGRRDWFIALGRRPSSNCPDPS